ncbi:DUF5926 family protein [Tetrasphaera sp. HKS02]|uniref:DUF5926 family protein n=1 Tax=Nostocoides sp. HKS02 TaxID=1813880 RepID=UPI0012B4AC45|nr:topoisomerase II [Tetrasphaera sp. HKS02]
MRRPFEGLPGETDWVAMREILPAATASVSFAPGKAPDGAATEATVATVLPLAWPGLHRADGTVFVGTQSGSMSGDASRDLAIALLAAATAETGTPVVSTPPATADSPRLQDLLDLSAPLEVTIHDGFDFWVGETELDDEGKASLERANESVIPTTKLAAADSAYWCRIGERTHLRLVLPDDEDLATDALARLHAAGDSGLGDDTRLLGAFRASGLLVPVWDLHPDRSGPDYEDALAAFMSRYAAALASTESLTAEQRRARSGLLSRQVTLR